MEVYLSGELRGLILEVPTLMMQFLNPKLPIRLLKGFIMVNWWVGYSNVVLMIAQNSFRSLDNDPFFFLCRQIQSHSRLNFSLIYIGHWKRLVHFSPENSRLACIGYSPFSPENSSLPCIDNTDTHSIWSWTSACGFFSIAPLMFAGSLELPNNMDYSKKELWKLATINETIIFNDYSLAKWVVWFMQQVVHNVAAKNYQQVDARSKGR